MSIQNYIEKQRAKPERERKKIAVIWTAVGFSIIFLIWIVSFREMNKSVETQADESSASFNDLKENFQMGKDSIQNMVQQLPSEMGTAETNNPNITPNSDNLNVGDNTDNMENIPAPDENYNSNQNGQTPPAVPQLP